MGLLSFSPNRLAPARAAFFNNYHFNNDNSNDNNCWTNIGIQELGLFFFFFVFSPSRLLGHFGFGRPSDDFIFIWRAGMELAGNEYVYTYIDTY